MPKEEKTAPVDKVNPYVKLQKQNMKTKKIQVSADVYIKEDCESYIDKYNYLTYFRRYEEQYTAGESREYWYVINAKINKDVKKHMEKLGIEYDDTLELQIDDVMMDDAYVVPRNELGNITTMGKLNSYRKCIVYVNLNVPS
jgi:hypothetical protein